MSNDQCCISAHNFAYFFSFLLETCIFKNLYNIIVFPENMENVVFIIKILETGMNVFKSHSETIESKKYDEILTIYECVEK